MRSMERLICELLEMEDVEQYLYLFIPRDYEYLGWPGFFFSHLCSKHLTSVDFPPVFLYIPSQSLLC